MNKYLNGVFKVNGKNKLMELQSKLQAPPIAKIPRLFDNDSSGSRKAKMSFQIQDFSKGTGKSNVIADYNVTPEQFRMLAHQVKRYAFTKQPFQFYDSKIWTYAQKDNVCPAFKFSMTRTPLRDNGEVARFPWYFCIESGQAQAQKTAVGGFYIKSGTFKTTKKVFFNMSDNDAYMMFDKGNMLIEAFANAIVAKNYDAWQSVYFKEVADAINQAKNPTEPAPHNSPEPSDEEPYPEYIPEAEYVPEMGYIPDFDGYEEESASTEEAPVEAPSEPESTTPAPLKSYTVKTHFVGALEPTDSGDMIGTIDYNGKHLPLHITPFEYEKASSLLEAAAAYGNEITVSFDLVKEDGQSVCYYKAPQEQ